MKFCAGLSLQSLQPSERKASIIQPNSSRMKPHDDVRFHGPIGDQQKKIAIKSVSGDSGNWITILIYSNLQIEV